MQDPPENLIQIDLPGSKDIFKKSPVSNGRDKFLPGNYYLDILYSLTEYQFGLENFQQFLR